PLVSFNLTKHKTVYELKLELQVNDKLLSWENINPVGYGFIADNETQELLMLSLRDARTLVYFYGKESLTVKSPDFKDFYKEFLIPLMKKHPVNFHNVKVNIEEVEVSPIARLYVKEMDNFLLLIPAFKYMYLEEET